MRSLLVVLPVFGATLLLAACGPGAASGQPGATKPVQVNVSVTEFKIEPSLTTFKVGTPYRFVVTNKGTVNHDFSITPPVMEGMAGHGDAAHEAALVVIKAEDLPPGTTKSVEVTFSKPTSDDPLEFACHVAGHYESGMHTALTVN